MDTFITQRNYCKRATTTTPPNDILLRLRVVFEDFGKILDVSCSDPLVGIVNMGAIGSYTYNLKVIIEVETGGIEEIEKFAQQEHWNPC